MMNKILLALNSMLIIAVIILFLKVYRNDEKSSADSIIKTDSPQKETGVKVFPSGGKIAYVNIDKLNEESIEIKELVNFTKNRKSIIESSVEKLSMQYQKKMQEYQTSAKAGIISQSELQAKEKEIMAIEKEAQNKQLQMDNLSVEITQKNMNFQKRVRDFLINWNKGKYDFILSYSESVPNMLLGNSSLEITDIIVTELNKEYKLTAK